MKRDWILLSAFVLVFRSGSQAASQDDLRDSFREAEWGRLQAWMEQEERTAEKIPFHEPVYDVHHYEIDVTIDPTDSTLVGTVWVHARSSVDTLSQVLLDLVDTLTVDGLAGDWLSFVHRDSLLLITLDRIYRTGETFSVGIEYHGRPRPFRGWGLSWRRRGDTPLIYTLVEPFFARSWWPCKDVPWDKADSSRVSITVPDGLVAVSNGLLFGVDSLSTPGWKTYRWKTHHPIPPYLISIAVANYVLLEDVFVNGAGDTVPLQHYVYPEDRVEAETTFVFLPEMMANQEDLYGAFPFSDEKYGHAEIFGVAAMEHNTATSWGDRLVVTNHGSDGIVAHELAHQWWGDLITCADWNDVWLNEGFATYSEGLWREHRFGPESLARFMGLNEYHRDQSVFVHRVPDADSLFSSLYFGAVYDKGAWVLHMLRHTVGDSLFFECLSRHKKDGLSRGGFATTEQFRASCESVAGRDLEWFFDQWVYRSGSPRFDVVPFVHETSESLRIHFSQDPDQDSFFRVRVDLTISLEDGRDTVITVATSGWDDTILVMPGGKATDVRFDEKQWLLDRGFSTPLDSALQLEQEGDRAVLSWTIEDDIITGVHLYRGPTEEGPWERITSSPIQKSGRHEERVLPGRQYYILRAVSESFPGFESIPSNVRIPSDYALLFGDEENPGPTNPYVVNHGETYPIRFNLPRSGRVEIKIYDIAGRLVRKVYDAPMEAGIGKSVPWYGKNDEDDEVAQGIYFIRLASGNFSETRKIVLIK